MQLKRLELSGFKSFAKTTALEFPSRITAIVGPNGSGKSNIAEGIRWVLGEQSMKSLRSRRGEDLIWSGSPVVPRVGKASVKLVFDNKDKKIPVGFEEVSLSRKIFRDGLNEYYLNESQVRLKDVVELMARLGLGEKKHNIIGQGEIDRFLLSSPKERKEMIEEAIGLRVYKLKKTEAERKLEITETNMKQVEAILQETSPHLKFLRSQARKAEMRFSLAEELKELQKAYFCGEKEEINKERKNLEFQLGPLRQKESAIKKELERLNAEITAAEKAQFSGGATDEEKALAAREQKRRELARKLGRWEGKLELEKQRAAQEKRRPADYVYIKEKIREAVKEAEKLVSEKTEIGEARAGLKILAEKLSALLEDIERGKVEEKSAGAHPLVKELEDGIAAVSRELEECEKEIEAAEKLKREERKERLLLQARLRELDAALRAKQEEERDLALGIQRLEFAGEKLELREKEFFAELGASGVKEENLEAPASGGLQTEEFPREELRKKTAKLRFKLEETGGIDESVIKEYQEAETRNSFLNSELEDLKKASASLKELIKELEWRLKNDFKEGFAKIKEEFHHYFRIIFGGGKASLRLVSYGKPEEENEILGAGENSGKEDGFFRRETAEEGLEIAVDLPRKRINSLNMLSGGERALCSIALLFAISSVNPPPFLILDETDAALDEANSLRYAAILRELSQKTQLILVTHNRETMKCAGVLYGVTMGEDGVSKLVSVKLEDYEKGL